jgi:ABC-type lipoprotein export system ATPase subunit
VSDNFLRIEGLSKVWPGEGASAPLPVFENLHFAMARGEFVCIVGHSGCGKSTILNILAGLDTASAGVVVMDGREVAGPSLDRGRGCRCSTTSHSRSNRAGRTGRAPKPKRTAASTLIWLD